MNGMSIAPVRGKVKSQLLDTLSIKEQSGAGNFKIRGYASKPVVDRVGDVVEVAAFAETMPKFMRNPIMLYMHDTKEPIGTWTDYQLRQDGLWMEGELIRGIPTADKARVLIEHGALRALSIGFQELDGEPNKETGHWHIKKLELLETSIVAIPANSEALFEMDESGKCVGIKTIDPGEETRETPALDFGQIGGGALAAEYAAVLDAIKTGKESQDELLSRVNECDARLGKVEEAFVKLVRLMAQRLAQEAGAAQTTSAE